MALACSDSGGDFMELGEVQQAVENGQLRPSSLNGGTVKIKIHPGPGASEPEYCSGQVISRDSVLTAAHCFTRGNHYEGGYVERKAIPVHITHQEPDGRFQALTADGEAVDVYLHPRFIAMGRWGQDVAVIQYSSRFANTTSSDVSALATDPNDRPAMLYLYGYGAHRDGCSRGSCDFDDSIDGELRRGRLSNFSWNSSNVRDELFASVSSEYDTDDADAVRSCRGDSGGPWKTVAHDGSEFSGVLFAVHGGGDNTWGGCSDEYSRAAMLGVQDAWVRKVVEGGAGSCTEDSHSVGTRRGTMRAETIVCW